MCKARSLWKHLACVLVLAAMVSVGRAQTYTVLYNFGTNTGDPIEPQIAGVIAQGRDGNLYSSSIGGMNDAGAMFKITPGGKMTVQYSFDSTDEVPFSGLTLGTDGNFYGGTNNGGKSRLGTVFKITPSGRVTVLHNFTSEDGATLYAPPIQGADGNFYGTTFAGGAYNGGTIYKLTPSGKLTTLHDFLDQNQGTWPYAPLVQASDGNFYGTTSIGGIYGDGVVFKMTPNGKFTVLHSFDGADGFRPFSPLVQASDGSFYGTTPLGGNSNWGVVFKITAKGKFEILHNMNGTTDGGVPMAGLVQATDGNLYGVNSDSGLLNEGVVFRITPRSPYAFTALYTYDDVQGINPEVTLIQHTNGILYGDNNGGGTAGSGTFFSFDLGLKPFISLVSTAGHVGNTIEILGQGFKGVKNVSFNGTPATFKVISSTYLTAKVPTGATTGFVTVTTPKGKLKSNKKFRVELRNSW